MSCQVSAVVVLDAVHKCIDRNARFALTSLHISRWELTASDIHALSRTCLQVTKVTLEECTHCDVSMLTRLMSLPALIHVHIITCDIDDTALSAWHHATSWCSITLIENRAITRPAVARLKKALGPHVHVHVTPTPLLS